MSFKLAAFAPLAVLCASAALGQPGAPTRALPRGVEPGAPTRALPRGVEPKGPPLAAPGWPPGARDPFGTGGRGDAPPDELRRQVLERFRAMRAWKLAEGLKLDEQTSAKLFPMLSKYDERDVEIMKERGDVMRGLRAEIEAPKPDNARIGAYIDRLLASRGKQRAIEDEKIKDLRKILSPVQQAKLVMLMPRIDQHFHERIRDAMNPRRGGPRDPF